MDTSKKLDIAQQLDQIANRLSPLMEILPFKRLDYYLGQFKRSIDGRTFYFDFRSTVASLSTCHNDMVIMVPVTELISRKLDGSFDFLEMVNLIFRRCTSDIGNWSIHYAKFDLQDYETITNQRGSSNSRIVVCDSLPLLRVGLSQFILPPGLVWRVCSSLQKMINDSIEKRKEILLKLTDLNLALGQIKG
jgi:hypothetical protein